MQRPRQTGGCGLEHEHLPVGSLDMALGFSTFRWTVQTRTERTWFEGGGDVACLQGVQVGGVCPRTFSMSVSSRR